MNIEQTNNTDKGFYPNVDLIINAFSACLLDVDISVKKNCLDFMIKKIDLSNKMFEERHFLIITESILILMKKNDFSLTKRIFKFLFKTNDFLKVERTEANLKIIDYLIISF